MVRELQMDYQVHGLYTVHQIVYNFCLEEIKKKLISLVFWIATFSLSFSLLHGA